MRQHAGLAARVLTLANSAALNRTGKAVGDLKTAINRIGHNNVRTAAVAFGSKVNASKEGSRVMMYFEVAAPAL